MLSNKKLVLIVAIVCIIVAVICLSWVLANSHSNEVLSIQEQVREDAIQYIKTNHPETVQFMNNLVWTGGRVETQLLGAETYTYSSQGWQVTIQYPVVPKPTYTITANYTVPEGNVSIPYAVNWQGTWNNRTITETAYTFAQ
jgi:hypothetical protein